MQKPFSASSIPLVSRRAAMLGMGAMMAMGNSRVALANADTATARLVVINIRGGLDGLSAVVPYGDTDLAGLRASLIPKNLLKIDSFYALDPALVNLSAMFTAGEALAIHAVGPITDTRSHFQGQDMLQGGDTQFRPDGWLNRVLGLLSYSGQLQPGLSLSTNTPLLMRGPVNTAGWAPDPFTNTSINLSTLLQTDASGDAQISNAYAVALQDRGVFTQWLHGNIQPSPSPLITLAEVAGICLASPNGPTVAVLETDSVDTHDLQTTRLPPLLSVIDGAIAALKTNLGAAWADTVVMTMTEFGRTAYANGTGGTDHGTGFAMFLAGGAVRGGRVVVNNGWPGLKSGELYGGRDLKPTVDFSQVAQGVLQDHLDISPSAQQTIFPGSQPPLTGLVN